MYALFSSFYQSAFQEVAATTLFTLYIDRLVEKASFGVIPFFASFLPRQTAEDRLQDIMERSFLHIDPFKMFFRCPGRRQSWRISSCTGIVRLRQGLHGYYCSL